MVQFHKRWGVLRRVREAEIKQNVQNERKRATSRKKVSQMRGCTGKRVHETDGATAERAELHIIQIIDGDGAGLQL